MRLNRGDPTAKNAQCSAPHIAGPAVRSRIHSARQSTHNRGPSLCDGFSQFKADATGFIGAFPRPHNGYVAHRCLGLERRAATKYDQRWIGQFPPPRRIIGVVPRHGPMAPLAFLVQQPQPLI